MLLYIAILFLLVSPDKLLLVFDRTHQYKTYWCRNYTEQDWGPHFNQQSSCLIASLPSARVHQQQVIQTIICFSIEQTLPLP